MGDFLSAGNAEKVCVTLMDAGVKHSGKLPTRYWTVNRVWVRNFDDMTHS